MYRQNIEILSRKSISKLVLVLIFLLLILIGCDQPIETVPPPPSKTPTCQPVIGLSTPSAWGETQLIVILYDPRSHVVGDQYLELENKEQTQDVPSFVSTIVPRLIKPGGQVSVFQLGYSSYDDARVSRLYSYASIPQLYDTPAPPETLTPLPLPESTPKPGLDAVAAKQNAKMVATERAAIETATASSYGCITDYWNTVVMQTATAWDETAKAEISETEKEFKEEFSSHSDGVNINETPFRTNALYYSDIYYGLSFASIIFREECGNYNECALVIIDDFGIYEEYEPDDLLIDLSNVDIYSVMASCKDINQPDCVSKKEYWNAKFKEFKAVKTVYWNGVHIEKNLLNIFGR